MAKYALDEEFAHNIEKNWYTYVERQPSFMQWAPLKYVPLNYKHKWYTMTRVKAPVISRDWTGPDILVEEAFTEVEKDMTGIHLDFAIPELLIEVSRREGMDVFEATREAMYNQMLMRMAEIFYQGCARPTVNGLFDDAGNTSTYNTVKWGAATGPASTVHDMADALITDGFDQPYDFIGSSNLYSATLDLIGTSTRDIELDAVRDTIGYESGGRIWWETITPATTVQDVIYPFPAAATTDGTALLVKSDPSNFNFLIGRDITLLLEPNIRRVGAGKNCQCGTMLAHVGVQVIQANSICKHADVDLA